MKVRSLTNHQILPEEVQSKSFARESFSRPTVVEHISSILKLLLINVRNYKVLRETKSLADTQHGRKVIVIANGPSANKISSAQLGQLKNNNFQIITVNFFISNPLFKDIDPDWVVLSDPQSLNPVNSAWKEQAALLKDRLKKNHSIKIVCPLSQWCYTIKQFPMHQIFSFIDVESKNYGNISPLGLRGYISMTAYKALAWAHFLGFEAIHIIGIDNTYAKDVYCDRNNRIVLIEKHADENDFSLDISNEYQSMAAFFFNVTLLFHDLKYFEECPIINLDQESLIEIFPKLEINEVLGA